MTNVILFSIISIKIKYILEKYTFAKYNKLSTVKTISNKFINVHVESLFWSKSDILVQYAGNLN